MDWSKCMDKDDRYALEQFHANIPKNRSTWTAPQGYFYAQHEYHHSNRGRNDNEFAPRKGSTTYWPIPNKVDGLKKVRIVDNIKKRWDNFGKGRGYTVYTHMLMKILD